MKILYTIIIFTICVYIVISITPKPPKPKTKNGQQTINQILNRLK